MGSALAAAEEALQRERAERAGAERALAQAHADMVELKLQRAQAEYDHAEKAGSFYSKVRSMEQQAASSLWGGMRWNASRGS